MSIVLLNGNCLVEFRQSGWLSDGLSVGWQVTSRVSRGMGEMSQFLLGLWHSGLLQYVAVIIDNKINEYGTELGMTIAIEYCLFSQYALLGFLWSLCPHK